MTATVAWRLGLSTHIVDCRAATIKRPRPHGPQLVSTLGSAVVLSGSGLGTRPADEVEVPQYLRIGGQQARLAIRNVARGAERPHWCPCAPEARPWHRREQVMFDLVVEPSEGEVGEAAAADVP